RRSRRLSSYGGRVSSVYVQNGIQEMASCSGTITTKKSRSSYVSRVFGAESLLRERGFAGVAAFDRLPAPEEEPDGLEGIVREINGLIALSERPRDKGTLQDYVVRNSAYTEFMLEFSAIAANSDPARKILQSGVSPFGTRPRSRNP